MPQWCDAAFAVGIKPFSFESLCCTIAFPEILQPFSAHELFLDAINLVRLQLINACIIADAYFFFDYLIFEWVFVLISGNAFLAVVLERWRWEGGFVIGAIKQ